MQSLTKDHYILDNLDYICIHCNKQVKLYKNTTSNLVKHLRRKHSLEFDIDVDKIKNLKNQNMQVTSNENNYFHKINENNIELETKNDIQNFQIILKAICLSSYPISIFNSKFLKNISNLFKKNVKIPSRNCVTKYILFEGKKNLVKIINEIIRSENYSLSADVWSNDKKTILSLQCCIL